MQNVKQTRKGERVNTHRELGPAIESRGESAYPKVGAMYPTHTDPFSVSTIRGKGNAWLERLVPGALFPFNRGANVVHLMCRRMKSLSAELRRGPDSTNICLFVAIKNHLDTEYHTIKNTDFGWRYCRGNARVITRLPNAEKCGMVVELMCVHEGAATDNGKNLPYENYNRRIGSILEPKRLVRMHFNFANNLKYYKSASLHRRGVGADSRNFVDFRVSSSRVEPPAKPGAPFCDYRKLHLDMHPNKDPHGADGMPEHWAAETTLNVVLSNKHGNLNVVNNRVSLTCIGIHDPSRVCTSETTPLHSMSPLWAPSTATYVSKIAIETAKWRMPIIDTDIMDKGAAVFAMRNSPLWKGLPTIIIMLIVNHFEVDEIEARAAWLRKSIAPVRVD